MKKLLIALAAVAITVASYGQGQVVFANRVTGVFDAPVMYGDTGHGPGPGYTAQLYLQPAGGGALTPLTPVGEFRPAGTGTGAIADRYWAVAGGNNLVDVPVASGANATFVVRAWKTSLGTFDAAKASGSDFGESSPFTVAVGGGTLPPANLTTMQGFTVVAIPEPATIALGVLGAAALLLRRRN
jgi:hypothetical protein